MSFVGSSWCSCLSFLCSGAASLGVVVVHEGRFATDPNNMEYYSCRLFPGFPGPTTESDEGLNGFLATRPGQELLVEPHTHRAAMKAATGV